MRKSALSVFILIAFCFAVTSSAFADADVTPPNVTKLHLSNKIFKVGKKNTLLITKSSKKKKTPTGTTILFNLDTNSYLAIGVYKAVEGRSVGTECLKPDDTNKDAKKCVRPVLINTMQRIGQPGLNKIAFSGTLDGKKLKTGAYAFGILATDEAGNSGKIMTRSFIVVKG
jgi:hypothetical protein